MLAVKSDAAVTFVSESDWLVFFFPLRFFLMYLINKDETEHTGQVQCEDTHDRSDLVL